MVYIIAVIYAGDTVDKRVTTSRFCFIVWEFRAILTCYFKLSLALLTHSDVICGLNREKLREDDT